MKGQTTLELCIGLKASFSKTITDADLILFAGITGDLNPVHINDVYAQSTMFKKRIAHGGLISALFSTVLGTQLPGNGTIYLSQTSQFLKPVYIGDTITATVVVDEIIKEKNRVTLKTIATNQHDEIVCEGCAIVKPPR